MKELTSLLANYNGVQHFVISELYNYLQFTTHLLIVVFYEVDYRRFTTWLQDLQHFQDCCFRLSLGVPFFWILHASIETIKYKPKPIETSD